jgi:hypothetical protein
MENNWLDVSMEEYKTLREESLSSMKGQQTIFNIGTATMGVLVASAFNFWDKPLLSGLILMAFIPLTAYLILFIWIGEVARMMRAGYFISLIEKKINSHFKKEDVLSWENWLRKKNRKGGTNQLKLNYQVIIVSFLSLSLLTIIIGFSILRFQLSNLLIIAIIAIEGVLFFFTFLYLFKTGKSFGNS